MLIRPRPSAPRPRCPALLPGARPARSAGTVPRRSVPGLPLPLPLLLLALSVASAPAAAPDERPPNVVIILCDDLGWGDLGSYGHPSFRTPRIDGLARQGVRLTAFYAPTPYCAPSRAALQTGRYPFRHLTRNPFPARDLAGVRGGDELGLPPAERTLAEALRPAGYRSALVGKWHLGHQPRFLPTRQGYDEYFGILYSNDMHPVELYDGEERVEYPVVQATLTRRYTERAVRFIRESRDRPFLLVLAHAMPHKPLAVSERFYTPETPDDLYADVMAELDWSTGRVLDTLDELGLEEDTIVWFTSDNGPWYGGSTGGLRGMKGRTWEGGLRVPCIVRWPGRIAPGRVRGAPAGMIDIFPTVLRAAGVTPPEGRPLDGRDILPVLSGDAPSPHDALLGMRGDRLCTVRAGRWKLHARRGAPRRARVPEPGTPWTDPRAPDGVRILAPYEQYPPSAYPGAVGGDPLEPGALFDLARDPAERRDLSGKREATADRLRSLHAAFEEAAREAETSRRAGSP